ALPTLAFTEASNGRPHPALLPPKIPGTGCRLDPGIGDVACGFRPRSGQSECLSCPPGTAHPRRTETDCRDLHGLSAAVACVPHRGAIPPRLLGRGTASCPAAVCQLRLRRSGARERSVARIEPGVRLSTDPLGGRRPRPERPASRGRRAPHRGTRKLR